MGVEGKEDAQTSPEFGLSMSSRVYAFDNASSRVFRVILDLKYRKHSPP